VTAKISSRSFKFSCLIQTTNQNSELSLLKFCTRV